MTMHTNNFFGKPICKNVYNRYKPKLRFEEDPDMGGGLRDWLGGRTPIGPGLAAMPLSEP